MAKIHVACWKEAYAGLMPDVVLANLSVANRATRWQGILSQPEHFNRTTAFVAERDGAPVGFGSCGDQRTPALNEQGFTSEVSAIYVLRSTQGCGVGSALMAAMAQTLLERDHRAASLWVLRENAPGRHFYQRLGGEVISQKQETTDGMTLIEVAYGWRDLHRLLGTPHHREPTLGA